MIGVLAVIAILAALLIPKIFTAINNARVNNAAVTAGTIKSAIADHYAQWGSLAVDGSSGTASALTVPYTGFDKVLLGEGFLDKPFQVKIGDGTTNNVIQLRACVAGTTAANASNSGYDLAGVGTTNTATGSYVAEAVITGVAATDAKELNDRVDGVSLGAASGADLLGRVKYADPSGGSTTVYIYLTHR
jgi:type II secretory pathway pseudopilin PulG